MGNFVLLHGAWHWGGCFQKLAAELQAAGHSVAMPDLTSHGLDRTPPEQVKDIEHYTAPARRVIEASREPVILLGHSMGGTSCTYLGEALPEKIRALVYLAAVMLPSGVMVGEYTNTPAALANPRTAEARQIISPLETGIQLDLTRPELVKAAFYSDCSEHDIGVAVKNVQPVQSYAAFAAPIHTTAQCFGRLRRAYIECTEDKAMPIEIQRHMQADSPGTEIFTLATSHSPFFSAPEALAEILLQLV